ncbi:MAG TPA: HEAT repeat domain-containing protein [Dehalococcoidia bacterium]|nr:HEAT repeat domain-containing protein [Dehalococcoidia bacterium]
MPPREVVEETLSRLRSIRDPWSMEARGLLTDSLDKGSSVVVQRAAKIIADAQLEGFEACLTGAFDRLLQGGVQADAGCGGKIAIVDALNKLGIRAEGVFLKACHHIQSEYSGDTALPLRSFAILALAEMGYSKVLEEAIELLGDSDLAAPLGAVKALVADGSRSALLLLRAQAVFGTNDAELMYECLSGLLERDPSSFDFVASFMSRGWKVPAGMALTLSRRPEVFELLKRSLQGASEKETQTLLTAMAMLRTDESLDYLFAQLNGRNMGVALQAYDALAIYQQDVDHKERLAKAVKASKYRRLFEGPRRSWTE